jgi:hypothetical protein
MYEPFQSAYSRDRRMRAASNVTLVVSDTELLDFFQRFDGASFGDGLYRVIHPADSARWHERVLLAFPDFATRATCFGYDWLGRAFALDAKRLEDGKPGVIMLEPGTGEVLKIPANLVTFHDVTLLTDHDAAVASSFYEKWRGTGGGAPDYDQCVGYKIPLFLAGVDDVENIELSDLDVYWHLMGQLIERTRGLPPGTRVRIK